MKAMRTVTKKVMEKAKRKARRKAIRKHRRKMTQMTGVTIRAMTRPPRIVLQVPILTATLPTLSRPNLI